MVRVTERMNPFPGLRPFEFGEEHLFFGREEQTDDLLDLLHHNRFLAVVGAPGSGKSSLVKAGLLPALCSGFLSGVGSSWRLAIVHPGKTPLRSLAAALDLPDALGRAESEDRDPQETATDGDRLVQALVLESTLRRGRLGLIEAVRQARLQPHEHLIVVVDGLEGLFGSHSAGRSREEQDEAAAFVKLLLAATQQPQQPIYVVVTLRSDFLGDCTRFAGLSEAINDSQYLIPRMARDQRRAAIEGPIGVAGGSIAPQLVQRMLNDMGNSLEQLPVLQHALMRTWDYWLGHHETNEPVDLRHYEAAGGIATALSNHADRIYAQLTEQQQPIARQMFQLLTERSDGRDMRRPATLQEIAQVAQVSQEEVRGVVNRFRGRHNSFLLPPQPEPLLSNTVLNISHDSLMRVWKRLQVWIKQEVDSARDYSRLKETATRYWLGHAELLKDPELAVALKWQAVQRPNSAWANRYGDGFGDTINFLERSRKAREHELELQEAELAEQERLRKRRLGQMAGAAAAMAIVAGGSILGVVLSGIHVSDTNRAREQAMNAEIDARISASESFLQAGQALEGTIEALTAGMQLQDSLGEPEPYLAMRVAAQLRETVDGVSEYSRIDGHEGAAYSVSFSPDGQTFASAGADTTVKLWNLEGETLSTLHGYGDRSTSVSYSPDGSAIVAASSDGTIEVWNLQGEVLAIFQGHEGAVLDVSFSPDGETLASAGVDATVRVWDLDGEKLVTLRGHEGAIRAISFSPDGKAIASAGDDTTARVWTLDGEELASFEGHEARVNGISFSSDNRTLASGSEDGTVKLWTVEGEELATLADHEGAVKGIRFGPDGQTLASTGADGTIVLWNAAEGRQIATLSGHDGTVFSASFSADGQMVVSAGEDGTVRLWNFQLSDLLARGCQQLASNVANVADVSRGDGQLCQSQLLAANAADEEGMAEDPSRPEPSDASSASTDTCCQRPSDTDTSADVSTVQPEPAVEPSSAADPDAESDTAESDESAANSPSEPDAESDVEPAAAGEPESVDPQVPPSPPEIATSEIGSSEASPPETEILEDAISAPVPRGRVTWPGGLALLSAPAGANVGGIGFNETVSILDSSEDGRWQRVRRESTGQEGWVKSGNLAVVTEAPAPDPDASSESTDPEVAAAPSSAPQGDRGRVTWPSGLAIRPVPQDGVAQIDGLAFNEIVSILESSEDGRWQRVRRDSTGTEGWVKAGNIAALTTSPNDSQTSSDPTASYRGRVTWRQGLAIRVEPRDGAAQIDGIPYSEIVTILSTSGDGRWQQVRREATGTVGWVKAGNIALVR